MNNRNELLARVYIVMMCFVFLSFWIIARVFYVNVIEGEKWRSKITLNVKWKIIEGDRGNIYSADGNILAASAPLYDIRMDLMSPGDANFEKHIDSLSYYISKYLRPDKTQWQWRNELRQGRQDGFSKKRKGMGSYLIKRNVKYEETLKIKEFPLWRLGQIRGGLIVERKITRIKPFKEMASRTIGIDRENSSKVGIEGSYNEYLKGEDVESLMRRMPGGYWLPVQEIDNVNLTKGADIITNLDVRIQDIVHEEVLSQLQTIGSEAGVAIVMEVKTGKVVAITNLSKGEDGIYREERNYAIGEKYAPGSVFKGATVLALLDDGLMKPDDLIDIERGTKRFWDRTVRDVTDIGKGNPVTFRDAMVFSSNVAMAKLSNHFYNKTWDDRKKFISKLRSFGLGDITGIDLIGEVNPVLKDTDKNRNDFYRTTIPWMSHGYETEYAPIQILNFYNAIANGGKLMKPYLVDRIERNNKPVQIKPQVLIEKIASDTAISTLQSFLEGVVLEGTASGLRNLGVRVAGKTGTAQAAIQSNDEEMTYNSTFAGYFPVEDPKYSVLVVFYKNPRSNYYASYTVVPVFKNIVEKILSLQAIDVERNNSTGNRQIAKAELPGFGTGYTQDFRTIFEHSSVPYINNGNSTWGVIDHEGNSVKVESFNFKTKLVPDVRGMGVRDAVYILENLGLTVKIEGYGRVALQSIAPHTRLNGQMVILTLK